MGHGRVVLKLGEQIASTIFRSMDSKTGVNAELLYLYFYLGMMERALYMIVENGLHSAMQDVQIAEYII